MTRPGTDFWCSWCHDIHHGMAVRCLCMERGLECDMIWCPVLAVEDNYIL